MHPSTIKKPYAIVYTASHDHKLFNKHKGQFLSLEHYLRKTHHLIEITISKPEDFKKLTPHLPDGSVNFVMLRSHGTPSSMQLSDDFELNAHDVAAVFDWLPKKTTHQATIALESCRTGGIEKRMPCATLSAIQDRLLKAPDDQKAGLLANVQHAFAHLMIGKPQSRIIAPSECPASYYWHWKATDQGRICFDFYNDPYQSHLITVTLGHQALSMLGTEKLFEKQSISNDTLNRYIKACDQDYQTLNAETIIARSEVNHPKAIKAILDAADNHKGWTLLTLCARPEFGGDREDIKKRAAKHVLELIEHDHAPADYLEHHNPAKQCSPLLAAIHSCNIYCVEALIHHGAKIDHVLCTSDTGMIYAHQYAQQLLRDVAHQTSHYPSKSLFKHQTYSLLDSSDDEDLTVFTSRDLKHLEAIHRLLNARFKHVQTSKIQAQQRGRQSRTAHFTVPSPIASVAPPSEQKDSDHTQSLKYKEQKNNPK
ncbi:MAG: hypothetical protein VXY77_02190 [Pseudomonadota bacterium]|nr:hypothetical protein [Pseudomonadota bacterium]